LQTKHGAGSRLFWIIRSKPVSAWTASRFIRSANISGAGLWQITGFLIHQHLAKANSYDVH
jgi:hypothetical protein